MWRPHEVNMYDLILISGAKGFEPVILRSDNLLLPTTFNWSSANILPQMEFYAGAATLQLQPFIFYLNTLKEGII